MKTFRCFFCKVFLTLKGKRGTHVQCPKCGGYQSIPAEVK